MGLMLAPRIRQRVEQVLVQQTSNSMVTLALQEPKVCSRELSVVLAGHSKTGRKCHPTRGRRRVLPMGLGPLPEMPGLSETTEPVPVRVPVRVQAQVPGMPVFPEARLVVLV